jgi:uncharacterized membrane protein YoaK (UPF0700 family)
MAPTSSLTKIWKHRHSTSAVVAALAAVGAWYVGDLGYTSMPPEWVIVAIAFAAGGIATAVVQEVRQYRRSEPKSQPADA